MASLRNRNGIYYAQWNIGAKQKRVSLKTDSLQVAKERLRRIEDRLAQGHDDPLPSRAPIPEIVAAYVRHIRERKTAKSAQTDVYYLSQMFGPCCHELEVTSRTITPATASLYKIATLMGNSPEICRRHYAALVPEAMGEEVEFDTRIRTTRACVNL